MYESSTVILATGISFGTPVKGEKEFLGKGVSYCATCDAMFYRNKTVAVAGFSKDSESEAKFLSEVASRYIMCHIRTATFVIQIKLR